MTEVGAFFRVLGLGLMAYGISLWSIAAAWVFGGLIVFTFGSAMLREFRKQHEQPEVTLDSELN